MPAPPEAAATATIEAPLDLSSDRPPSEIFNAAFMADKPAAFEYRGMLLVEDGASLPAFCVRTDQPTSSSFACKIYDRRSAVWLPPLFAFVTAGTLIYLYGYHRKPFLWLPPLGMALIILFILAVTAVVMVHALSRPRRIIRIPLCKRLIRRYRRSVKAAWAFMGLSAATYFSFVVLRVFRIELAAPVGLIAVALFVLSLIFATLAGSAPPQIQTITPQHVIFKKVHRQFLARLPRA